MGKVLVLYDSTTGNTEKMAYLVAEGAKRVEGIEVRIKKEVSNSEAVLKIPYWDRPPSL